MRLMVGLRIDIEFNLLLLKTISNVCYRILF